MMEALGRWGIWLLSSLLAVAVARAAATLTWSLSGQTGSQVLDIATAFAEPRTERRVEIGPILKLAPFGTAAAPVVAEAVAKETSLGLVLHGVVVAAPEASIAVIASNAGRAEIYGIGDSVDGKATVLEVLNDKVMLQVGGTVETLSFPAPAQKPSGVASIVAGITNSGVSASPSPRRSDTPVVEEYRRRIAQNPQVLLDSMGLSVSQDGYRVDQNANPTILRTGLRPGDLVSKVNGEPVGDIERDRKLMDTIIASGQVRIEVMRQGRPILMSFPLK